MRQTPQMDTHDSEYARALQVQRDANTAYEAVLGWKLPPGYTPEHDPEEVKRLDDAVQAASAEVRRLSPRYPASSHSPLRVRPNS